MLGELLQDEHDKPPRKKKSKKTSPPPVRERAKRSTRGKAKQKLDL
jgi:hypothetical protein